MKEDDYDGFIFGTPVHYGGMTSFLDRVFLIDEYNGEHFAGKPAAAIATCRRSGATAACRLSRPNTGMWCMGIRRMKYAGMRKDCRPCVSLQETWHGCLNASA